MSDFLKKFKSVFIVEDTPSGSATSANETTASSSPPTPPPTAPAPTPEVSGSVSNRFLEMLAGALEKNNQPGFDYFEFRQSLVNLSKMPMDESTRFQSAFAMAQTMGVDKAKLTDSAKFYLQVLGGEKAKFDEAHAAQRAKLIGNREEDLKKIETGIAQKLQQIEDLKKQIEADQGKTAQIKAEIEDSTVKIETTKADFYTTFDTVSQQLADDITKIQQYL